MQKDWRAILPNERKASRDFFNQHCPKKYHLGAYYRGKFYLTHSPDVSEVMLRAHAFQYQLANLPLTCDPRQAFAGGCETFQTDELPQDLTNYELFFGADAGHYNRPFSAGNDHAVFNIPKLLQEGFSGLLKQIEASRKQARRTAKQLEYLDAMEICCQALSAFFTRFGESLREQDEEMANRLMRLATEPAGNFTDAIQLLWLTFIALEAQKRSHLGLGRIDQYLWPFYEKDLQEGRITRETALELLCHLWTKIEGIHEVTNICIGGQTPEGEDATNELSFLVLEATRMVRSPSTNLSARLHDKSSDAFMLACADTIKTGVGFPAIFNDEVTIPMLVKNGIPRKDARNYCMVGCVETYLPGRQQAWSDSRFETNLSFQKTLEHLTDYDTYEAFYAAFLKQIEADITTHANNYNAMLRCWSPERFPDPAWSLLTDDCIARAKDVNAGGAHFRRFHGASLMGVGTIVDSLAVLKKLVYEQKIISREELHQALEQNFEGQEPLRQMLLNRAPKYGNDDDFVDEIAQNFIPAVGQIWQKLRTLDGGRFQNCMATNVSNIPTGQHTKATPDGRFAWTPLSDAASPYFGRDTHGPTAFLKSITKPDYSDANCTVVNMRFLPQFFAEDEGCQRFLALMKEFVKRRGHEMQFNVTDNKVLEEAIRHPDEYRSLVVRVSGFSAYFINLEDSIKKDVMRRHAHEAI